MKQNGNALFLILIAVALFAALSYAVTQSGRGGGNADRETAKLQAARVLQYVASIEAAMNKMKLLNGTADTEFSFDTAEWGFSDYQHSTTQPDQNKVFHPDGGGATWQDFSEMTTFWKFVGENAVTGLGECADNSSSACKELMFMLTDISDTLCIEINRNTIGIDTIPVDDAHSGSLTQNASAFDGVYGTLLVADYEIGNAPEVVGQPIGCIRDGSRNVLYAVLLAR